MPMASRNTLTQIPGQQLEQEVADVFFSFCTISTFLIYFTGSTMGPEKI